MSSEKGTGAINSKYLNAATIILAVAAVVFVLVLMFAPGMIGIYSASQSVLYEEKIFNTSEITSISIEISDKDWADMLANPTAEEFHRCNVTINGETFYSVGIRTKGMSSLSSVASSDSDRYSFKLKADKYVDGQTFFGLEEFVVNNMHQDPTYMKEYLSYDMMAFMGVATPLFNFAEISMNGEYWGLYLAIEAMEEDFAMRVYGSDFGQLYKPETMSGMGMGGNRQEGGNFGGFNGEMPDMPADGNMMWVGQIPDSANFGARTEAEVNEAAGTATTSTAAMGMAIVAGTAATSTATTGTAANVTDSAASDAATGTEIAPGANMPADAVNGNRPDFGGMAGMGGGGPGGMSTTGGGADLIYTDDNISSYSQIFDNAVFSSAKNSDFNRVVTALKYLNAGEELETYVDVDGTLRYFAVNTVLVNLDSYVGNMKHNYYLYEKNGQITILPWDYNLAFGSFQGGSASGSINFPIDTPVSGVSLEDRPLIGVLLTEEEYMAMYHDFLQELVNDYFNSGYYDSKITELGALIGESVKNDPTAFYSYDDYLKSLDALRLFGELRAESIQGQLDGTVPSTSEEQTANPDALIDASSLNMSDLGSGMGGGGIGGGMAMDRAGGNNMRQRWQTDANAQTAAAVPADPNANANASDVPPQSGS